MAEIVDQEALNKVKKARVGIILGTNDEPFFGTILIHLKLTEQFWHPTGWTDGTQIGYNPAFINALDIEQVKTFLVHEAMHIACMHHLRMQERHHQTWNIAGDHVVNLAMESRNYRRIELGNMKPFCDPRFQGMYTEQVYAILEKKSKPKEGGGTGQGKGAGKGKKCQDGSGKKDPNQTQDPNQNQAGNQPQKGNNKSQNGNQPQDGQQGLGAGKNGQNPPPPTGIGDILPHPELENATQATVSRLEDETAGMIQSAIMNCKQMGTMPGELEIFVNNLLKPKINWRQVLQTWMQTRMPIDQTWVPPNRRFVSQDIYLPSMSGEEMELGVFIDTSGSVWGPPQELFLSELSGLLQQFRRIKVHVVQADTKVTDAQEITQDDLPLDVKIKGGGGTCFKPPFAYVEEKGIALKCAIYMTDLYCNSYPDPPPGYPVLWVCCDEGGYKSYKPPFGEVLFVDEKDAKP